MSLFKQLRAPDRQATQLAYRVKYWPYQELSTSARELLRGQKRIYLRKHQIESAVNDDKTLVRYPNSDAGRLYRVVWAYNNMPTEQEWGSRSDDALILCEFRTSPAIPEYAVCILSFELPSSRLAAHRQGEFV